MVMLSGADVAALKLLSLALLAVTMQIPVVTVFTMPAEGFTRQMVGVLLAKLTIPVPLPPLAVNVAVLPNTRLGGLLTTISVA